MYLGLDLGLSSLKLCLIEDGGKQRAVNQLPLSTQAPHPAYAEQNPQDWWRALDDALLSLKSELGDSMQAIKALSITAGAHIAVLCDDSNAPLRPAILWNDQRAASLIPDLGALPLRESGNQPSATWSLAHLFWLRQHEPETWRRVNHIRFAKDWLRGQLTGDRLTDPGDACGSMLMNYQTRDWSQPLLEMVGLSAAQLPQVVAPATEAGPLKAQLAGRWGLSQNIKILVGSIDTSIEWLCWGQPQIGQTTLKLASAGVVSQITANMQPMPPVSLYPYLTGEQAYYAAGMNQCMTALNWVADRFFTSPQAFYDAAAQSPAGAGGVHFYPYLNGERAPLWRADLTASFVNMTRASNIGNLARAAIEGISYGFREIYDSMPGAEHKTNEEAIGLLGGGSSQTLLCQIIAEILGRPVMSRPERDAAYGAAIFAGAADGVVITPPAHQITIFEPNSAMASLYDTAYRGYKHRRASLYPNQSD